MVDRKAEDGDRFVAFRRLRVSNFAFLKVHAMHAHCPYCQGQVVQTRNQDGPNFCPQCRKLFYVPEEPRVPSWILGVLVILVANWQVLLNH